jgi:hypothetical protein
MDKVEVPGIATEVGANVAWVPAGIPSPSRVSNCIRKRAQPIFLLIVQQPDSKKIYSSIKFLDKLCQFDGK